MTNLYVIFVIFVLKMSVVKQCLIHLASYSFVIPVIFVGYLIDNKCSSLFQTIKHQFYTSGE